MRTATISFCSLKVVDKLYPYHPTIGHTFPTTVNRYTQPDSATGLWLCRLSLSLSLTHSHSHSHSLSLTLSHSLTHSLSLSLSLLLSLTLSLTHTRSLSHSLSLLCCDRLASSQIKLNFSQQNSTLFCTCGIKSSPPPLSKRYVFL
jgi:hypothetical protein